MPGDSYFSYPSKMGDGQEDIACDNLIVTDTSLFYGPATFLGSVNFEEAAVTGVVTSVGLTSPSTLFTISNSPITSSGNISINTSTTPTGTGTIVLSNSPILTTPDIGAAVGTSLRLSSLAANAAVATDASNNLMSVANTGIGNNVLQISPNLITPNLGAAVGTSLQLSALTENSALATDASKNIVSITNTGSGNNVLATTPSIIAPEVDGGLFLTPNLRNPIVTGNIDSTSGGGTLSVFGGIFSTRGAYIEGSRDVTGENFAAGTILAQPLFSATAETTIEGCATLYIPAFPAPGVNVDSNPLTSYALKTDAPILIAGDGISIFTGGLVISGETTLAGIFTITGSFKLILGTLSFVGGAIASGVSITGSVSIGGGLSVTGDTSMSVLRVTSYLESEDSFKTSGLETLLTTTTTTINSTNTYITGTTAFSITSDAFNVDATETSIGTATISLSAATSFTVTSPLLTLSETLFRVGTAEARFDTEQLNMTLGALPSTWTISDLDITGGLLTIHSGLTITNSVVTINTTDLNLTTTSIDTTVTDFDLNIVTLTLNSATSTLSLGSTTINAGTTTMNTGTTTITTAALSLTTTGSTMQLGALNLTAGACSLNLGAINLTAGVITALAPITVAMAASALTVTTTSGAIALTVGSGAITLTTGGGAIAMSTGAGGLALTTGAGVLALTTGAGLMQFTTGVGGINMYVTGGGISMITTVGAVKLSCGTGDAELSASVGACFIYAPVGGINVGKISQRNGHFEVYTTNGATAAGTANILFSTSSTDANTGPGNFQVETTSAYNGHINLFGKGYIRLHTASYVEIRTNNLNVLTFDNDAATSNYTWRFPSDAGTAGQVLTSNGSSSAQTWTTPTVGTITSVTASSPLASSGGSTPNISISSSTGSGAVVLQSSPTLTSPNLGSATGTSLQLSGLTALSALATDASKNLVSISNTGSGNNVLSNSPTLVNPVLGAATGTSLQLSGLTASFALATDASKNLISVENTGSGSNVLATSPVLTSPNLGDCLARSISCSLPIPLVIRSNEDTVAPRGIYLDADLTYIFLNSTAYPKGFSIVAELPETPCLMRGAVKLIGSLNMDTLAASSSLGLDSLKNVIAVTNNGSGNNVLTTSPTLITPNIGTAMGTSLQLSSLTASSVVVTDSSKKLVSITGTKFFKF